jgi:formylmethanofuran dehydrogenase subunit E
VDIADEVLPRKMVMYMMELSKAKKCEDCGEYVKNAETLMHKSEGFCEVIMISK